MELRTFAEQVLYGTTLEEKLSSPGELTDSRPGSSLVAPAMPGRPPELRFKERKDDRTEFPGLNQLDQERERGVLLHFFANHELLATELMALVLLRFPEAPPAFRRGILRTLKDEQLHTRLYIERMRACGIEFGELPVNGYFWRTVSTMENPLDYVSSLCLTFEQANLDYCRHFAQGFQQVGDADTARLLEGIYRDEISHVAYGLKWFRRWKNPQESDWEAFCRQLKFPLSPNRAKGISFNREGRREAGLDPDFIEELNVYAQSKGRPPSVFCFNPFAESYIAQGQSFHPGKHETMLAHDLSNLPQFLCRRDDVVLVRERPSRDFLESVQSAGIPLPEFVEWTESTSLERGPLGERKLSGLRPWAWSPDSLVLFAPLFANVTGAGLRPEQCFHEGTAQLYSKAWSAAFLRQVLTGHEAETWLCPPSAVGEIVETHEEALAAVDRIRATGHHKVVVKQAYGLAGQNMIRLLESELLESQRRWLEKAARTRRPLVVEPWLDRVLDFSLQLEMGSEGPKLRGFTQLIVDGNGQYQGNRAEADHARKIPGKLVNFFPKESRVLGRLYVFYEALVEELGKRLRSVGYAGPVGIDAFIYRGADGGFRLKPVVEINPRYTMGRLILELMKHVCPGVGGGVRLMSLAMIQAEGCADFPAYARHLQNRFPLQQEGRPVPRIKSGGLCLNDPSQAQAYLAVFQVS